MGKNGRHYLQISAKNLQTTQLKNQGILHNNLRKKQKNHKDKKKNLKINNIITFKREVKGTLGPHHRTIDLDYKIISWNMNGLNSPKKRNRIFHYLKKNLNKM